MGMFDEITVHVPLPDDLPAGPDVVFQTKSLACWLDDYQIRSDGTLWHEEYDTEDRSDRNAQGIMRFAGIMTRVNKRWVRVTNYTGEIEFHRWNADAKVMHAYSTYFVDGVLKSGPHKVEH